MGLYRLVYDVYSSRAGFPGARIVVFVNGIDPTDARRKVHTLYASETGVVTLNGGVSGAYGGRSYMEWECVSTRKLADDGNGVTLALGVGLPYRNGTVAGYVQAYASCEHTVANPGNSRECCTGTGGYFRAYGVPVVTA